MEERLSDGETPTAFGQNNSGKGVGGSTLHWGAFTPRPDARDLKLKTTAGLGEDWPIDPDELTGYIETVEHFVGVSGPADYPWDPVRRYELPPPARNASSDMMIRGCEAVGIPATDAPAALVTRDWHQDEVGTRPACVGCGSCHQGCRSGAKVSMDTTYLPLAVANGAEIRADRPSPDRARRAGEVRPSSTCATGSSTGNGRGAVPLCRGRRDSASPAAHRRRQQQRPGRPELHGARRDPGLGHVRRRDARLPRLPVVDHHRRHRAPRGVDFVGGYLIQSLGAMPLTLATTLARGAGLGVVSWSRTRRLPLHGRGRHQCRVPAERAEPSRALGRGRRTGSPKAVVTFTPGPNEKAIEEHAIRPCGRSSRPPEGATSACSPAPPTPSAPAAWAPTPRPPSSTPTAAASTSPTCGSATTASSRARSSRTRR